MAKTVKKKLKLGIGDDSPKKSKSSKSTDVVELKTVNFAAKYRPRKIEDYVGQDHIVKVFRGWQKSGVIPATLMVTGHYGSGKTTFARLLAKYINCDTFSACGKCRSCQMADRGKDAHPDIMSYDMGGEHGKVDGSQKIIDSIQLSPMFKRRVFIFDEAHLMSPQAESKFLVTTEEPPEHVVIIFVTTNPEKMKPMLVSRATGMPIQPIKVDVIHKRLTEIADEEGILPKKDKSRERAEAALHQVAEYAGGQMRGAIGMVQTIYSSVIGGEKFDKELVNELASADPEIEMEGKAVQMIGAYLDMDLIACIQFMREANNPRALVTKARWVIHSVIGHMAETNKWQTAGLKMFLAMAKQNKIDVNPIRLIYLQRALAEAEVAFNSTSIPADIMMESLVTTLMADLYSGKMSVDVVPFDSEADKSEKKKKKKKK